VGVVKIATSKRDIKRLDLRFQPLSQEIAICHSLHGGLASGSILSRMRSTGFAGASHSPSPATGVLSNALLARALDRIEPASPIMLTMK
jgi:hypothetical protein